MRKQSEVPSPPPIGPRFVSVLALTKREKKSQLVYYLAYPESEDRLREPANIRLNKTLEESRSRWGDRTSNPGGAVRRSQVGSTPILLRHFPRHRARRRGLGREGTFEVIVNRVFVGGFAFFREFCARSAISARRVHHVRVNHPAAV